MNSYKIIKHIGTHADALAAIGAADLLRHLDPRVVEFEDHFEIRLPREIRRSDMDAIDPGFSYLLRPGKEAPGVPPERIVPLRSSIGDSDTVSARDTEDHRMYLILSRMKAYAGPNKVVSEFAASTRAEWADHVWDCLGGGRKFTRPPALVQLFNPQSARGYALLKPSCTDRSDRTKDAWAEPFLEWLRFRGYFEGSAGWFTGGDLRFLCPIPANIPYDEFVAAAAAFRALRLGGSAVKIDCRAVLGLARLLIEHAATYRRPARSVRGIWVTHYKDMGQAHTVIATEQLALPDWFGLRSSRQAALWLRTLEEHDTVLRRLTDTHSDEFALLKQYRRTFQSRRGEAIDEFTVFLRDYGALLFKRRSQDHWVLPQFTVSGISAIVSSNPDLRKLLRNPGFRAVAAAIRASTVGAQAERYRGRPDHREIRYGLLSGLRSADFLGRSELLGKVASFVAAFNQETARRRASGLRAMRIQESELLAFQAQMESAARETQAGALLCGMSACLPGLADAAKPDSAMEQALTA